jgi:signal transduction histidine kinase
MTKRVSPPSSPGATKHAMPDPLAEIARTTSPATRRLAERAVANAKESFVRRMGHDLVNRVGSIRWAFRRMSLQLAKPALDGAALATLITEGNVHCDRMLHLLSRAREVVYQEKPHYCEERLAPIVEEARTRAVKRLGARAERLAFTSKVKKGLTLHADYDALVQALEDLVTNAAEAYPDDAPRLEVSVTAREVKSPRGRASIEILVADRGRGIHEESLDILFTPFGTSKPEGTGLGMVLAKRRVEEMHGGTLAIETALGQGTRARVVLPRTQAQVHERRRLTIDEIMEMKRPAR